MGTILNRRPFHIYCIYIEYESHTNIFTFITIIFNLIALTRFDVEDRCSVPQNTGYTCSEFLLYRNICEWGMKIIRSMKPVPGCIQRQLAMNFNFLTNYGANGWDAS
jgi:hypothetical protein